MRIIQTTEVAFSTFEVNESLFFESLKQKRLLRNGRKIYLPAFFYLNIKLCGNSNKFSKFTQIIQFIIKMD